MNLYSIVKGCALFTAIVSVDFYFNKNSLCGAFLLILMKRTIYYLVNAAAFAMFAYSLALVFIWLLSNFSSYVARFLNYCVHLQLRFKEYVISFFMPSAYRSRNAVVQDEQVWMQQMSPLGYGDHRVPLILVPPAAPAPVHPEHVHHHHVHEVRTPPPRRRIPRTAFCTLHSPPSASSVGRRRTLLENLEAEMRHVYPSQAQRQLELPEVPVPTSPVPADADATCIINGSPCVIKPNRQFTPVVKTESTTNISVSGDTLVLHQFPRSLTKPCLFCSGMHLETYIRLIEIPCDVVFDCWNMNGPWLSYKKKKIVGVKTCLEFLKAHFSDKALMFTVHGERGAAEWSHSHLLNHLYWVLKWWRWEYESGREFSEKQPHWNTLCEKSSTSIAEIKPSLRSRGFNMLSVSEMIDLMFKDLSSLNVIIQNSGNCFLLGPSPTEIDSQAFSVLSQVVWGNDRCLRRKIDRDYPLINEYCGRLRNMLWPDWDEQLAKSLLDNSASHICKIFDNMSINDASLDRGDDSEKLAGQNSRFLSSSPLNREFRNSYYHITPAARNSSAAVQPPERYSVTEDDEAEFLYVCSKVPIRSEVNLTCHEPPADDSTRYGLIPEDENANTADYSQNDARKSRMHYTSHEEYFDDI